MAFRPTPEIEITVITEPQGKHEDLFNSFVLVYEDLFPDPLARPDPTDIANWIEAEQYSPESTTWPELLIVSHVDREVTGFIQLNYHRTNPFAYGAFLGISKKWRFRTSFQSLVSRAEDQLLRLQPHCQGVFFEVDLIDFGLVEQWARAGDTANDVMREQSRRLWRISLFQNMGAGLLLDDDGRPFPILQLVEKNEKTHFLMFRPAKGADFPRFDLSFLDTYYDLARAGFSRSIPGYESYLQDVIARQKSRINSRLHFGKLYITPGMKQIMGEFRFGGRSSSLSASLKGPSPEGLYPWCETLPFPLASIFRAWRTTLIRDFKTKYEYLLRFFEATAEFMSVILLSAFSHNNELIPPHREKLAEAMRNQGLSFTRATFGTWKLIFEYLSSQTRRLSKEECRALFSDLSPEFYQALSTVELASVLSTTNKWRNDWQGHGGAVGPEEAKLRNEQLLGQLQKLHQILGNGWTHTRLVHSLQCIPSGGMFENEVEILMGSHSQFEKAALQMNTWLDTKCLYLCGQDSRQALKLLPLVRVGPSPPSANNACYFFNRLEDNGNARFISYHFTDQSALTGHNDQAQEAIEAIKALRLP